MQPQHTNEIIDNLPDSEASLPDRTPNERVITLSNGDVFVFPAKFKGLHRLEIERIRSEFLKDSDYIDSYPAVIRVLADSWRSAEGEEFEVTNKYIQGLDIDDFDILITDTVEGMLRELMLKKKTSIS